MERTNQDVDAFLRALPEDVRDDMVALHEAISGVMQGYPVSLYEGALWGGTHQEIIGYGTYRYTRSDKQQVEWFLVGLAVQKNYLSVYVNAVEGRKYLAETLGPDVGKVKVGKSSISFRRLQDIDVGKLVELVERAREVTEAG